MRQFWAEPLVLGSARAMSSRRVLDHVAPTHAALRSFAPEHRVEGRLVLEAPAPRLAARETEQAHHLADVLVGLVDVRVEAQVRPRQRSGVALAAIHGAMPVETTTPLPSSSIPTTRTCTP